MMMINQQSAAETDDATGDSALAIPSSTRQIHGEWNAIGRAMAQIAREVHENEGQCLL